MTSFLARDRLTRTRARVPAILAAAALSAVGSTALATDYHWVVANGTWNNGPNWNPFGEPLTGDIAYVDYASNAVCHVIGAVGNPGAVLVFNGDTLDLEHNGIFDGFVQVSGNVQVGTSSFPFANTGTLNVFGKSGVQNTGVGHLAVGGTLYALRGSVINQSGGTVALTGASAGLSVEGGTYNMSAGVLSSPYGEVSGTGALNLSGTGIASLGGFTLFGGAVNQTGGQLNVAGGNGGYSVYGQHFLQGGALTCDSLLISDSTKALVSFEGGSLSIGTLTIDDGARLVMSSGGGKVLRSTAVNIPNGGIDLTNNAMVVDYTGASPLASIAFLIKNGAYNPIDHGVFGIVSSTAVLNGSSHATGVGYGEASTLGVSSFKGQSVDSTSVLIGYTWLGDADLDGKVNALDFNALAKNFGKTPGSDVWTQGDFNYDGNVNSLDFTSLASNFNQPALSSTALATLVPEPAMLAIPMLVGLWIRRRME